MKFAKRFVATKEIGTGSFGTVYKGLDLKYKRHVAIKVEAKNCSLGYLNTEARVLKACHGAPGFAKLIW
jgi:serine/threonine protein kinase